LDVDSLFLTPLSSESKLPLYHQLADQLREAVRQGAIPPDKPIPREIDLAAALGVSRSVVRQAILQLVQEGYLRRIPGKGTFAQPPPIEYDLLGFYNFKKEVERQNQALGIRLVAFETMPVDPVNGALFGVGPDDRIVGIWRTLLVGGNPVLLERTTVPRSRVPGLTEDDGREGGFFDIFTSYGLRLVRARRYLEARVVDAFESQELGLKPGAPVLVIDRYTYGEEKDGPVLVRCVWAVRGDRCRHFINIDAGI